MSSPLLFTDDVEQPPADEVENIARIIAILRQTLKQQLEQSGEARRDVHVKSHGCAAAELQVRSELPVELAQGLFAVPRTYSAFVRFSNSAPWPQPDAIPDGRGLALQVDHDLAPRIQGDNLGRTQDFVMVNHPTFIARDVEDYLRLEEFRLQATLQPVLVAAKMLTSSWNPLRWRWRALLAAAKVAGQPASHPTNYTYYSMVPFRFGRYIAKYRVVPRQLQPTSILGRLTTFGWQVNAMRRLLEETLARGEIKFEFQVQLRTSEPSMPIEDATVEWPESESPYRAVADVVIPRQDISRQQIKDDGEGRAYNVWNALTDHRPLGGINRVRRQAYAVSSAFRNAPTVG
jgi:catalase